MKSMVSRRVTYILDSGCRIFLLISLSDVFVQRGFMLVPWLQRTHQSIRVGAYLFDPELCHNLLVVAGKHRHTLDLIAFMMSMTWNRNKCQSCCKSGRLLCGRKYTSRLNDKARSLDLSMKEARRAGIVYDLDDVGRTRVEGSTSRERGPF